MDIRQDIVVKQYHNVEFDDLLDQLVAEIGMRNYKITRISNIDNIHQRKDQFVNFDINFKHYKIVELCSLNRCAELISSQFLAGVFMPTRFIIFDSAGNDVRIAYLKPTAFAQLFASPKLMDLAQQLEDDLIGILNELDF